MEKTYLCNTIISNSTMNLKPYAVSVYVIDGDRKLQKCIKMKINVKTLDARNKIKFNENI